MTEQSDKTSTVTYKALLIGINYIGSRAELRGCINDVIHFKQFIQQKYPIKESDIRILTEAAPSKDNYPTRANIIAGMKWLVSDLPTGPCKLILQYSGHGSYIKDYSGDEADHRDETICPLDWEKSSDIVDDELRSILVSNLPANADLFCLFDCCHSGTVLDLRYNYKINHRNDQYTIDVQKQYPKCEGKVVVFSGCKDNEVSSDAYINRTAQGAMTFSLLQSIKDLEKNNKDVTYKKLMERMNKILKSNRFSQNPQLSSANFLDLQSSIFN